MSVNKNKDSKETGIKLDFELDSDSSGDETDPDATQAVGIQASPNETPPASPVIMQREADDIEADGIELPQNMPETRDVRFKASADSEGRRGSKKCGKLSSQELNALLRKEKPKDIRECMKMIEEAINAKAGPMEALVTVTRVAAIAIGYADADRRKKATERRKELARKRKELKAELKAEQAKLALEHKSEDQKELMHKH